MGSFLQGFELGLRKRALDPELAARFGKEEIRRRAMRQFSEDNFPTFGQLSDFDLNPTVFVPAPAQVETGVRPPIDELQAQKVRELITGEVTPSPPVTQSPSLPNAPDALNIPLSSVTSQPLMGVETQRVGIEKHPLDETRLKVAAAFENFPRLGRLWVKRNFGLSDDEAEAFLSPGEPLPKVALEKIGRVQNVLASSGQKLQIPNLRFGTDQPEFKMEMALQEAEDRQRSALLRRAAGGAERFQNTPAAFLFDKTMQALRSVIAAEDETINKLIQEGRISEAENRRNSPSYKRAIERLEFFQARVLGEDVDDLEDKIKAYPDLEATAKAIRPAFFRAFGVESNPSRGELNVSPSIKQMLDKIPNSLKPKALEDVKEAIRRGIPEKKILNALNRMIIEGK